MVDHKCHEDVSPALGSGAGQLVVTFLSDDGSGTVSLGSQAIAALPRAPAGQTTTPDPGTPQTPEPQANAGELEGLRSRLDGMARHGA